MDELNNKIQNAYKTATSYPDLVNRLIALGIQSYTVDVATSTILYRLPGGDHVLHNGNIEPRVITTNFHKEQVIQAVRNTQQGKTDYPAFMDEIARAGVRFYEATLNGQNKRVTYIGKGGAYEESIPI